MGVQEIDFESDSFADIVANDSRYHPHAYAFLVDTVHFLCKSDNHVSAEEIMHEFRERALEQYGPLAYTVLTEWGLSNTGDIGEMMLNLVEGHRIRKDEDDNPDDFLNGYDFAEAFQGPYRV